MIWFVLAACGLGGGEVKEERPSGPDAQAAAAAIDALCKLYEGAEETCKRGETSATAGKTEIAVQVFVEREASGLGTTRLSGRVETTVKGKTAVTRFSSYGGSRDEALQRGFHEWAVLSGVAIVDWLMDDETRPALLALEPEYQPTELKAGAYDVLRGWTYARGVKLELDHAALLESVVPLVSPLDASQPHVLQVVLARETTEDVWTCHLDGAVSAELCALAEGWGWPATGPYEAKQVYLLTPPS